MDLEYSLNDLATREEQLEQHLLRSTEYLRQLDRQLKRHIAFIYLGITLILFCLLIFTCDSVLQLSPAAVLLISITSLLSIISCFLLIQTRNAVHRLNLAFLNEQEKSAINALRQQRLEIMGRLNEGRGAELN